jgi:hypothetical protein
VVAIPQAKVTVLRGAKSMVLFAQGLLAGCRFEAHRLAGPRLSRILSRLERYQRTVGPLTSLNCELLVSIRKHTELFKNNTEISVDFFSR